MPHASFVHLRARSAYSVSEGAIKVPDLVGLAKRHGMPALALTDHANLFGALEFSLEAQEAGVQPIPGCILDLDLARDPAAPRDMRREANGARREPDGALLLLAKDGEGWRNLSRLVSRNYIGREGSDPIATDPAQLAGFADGVIALTGGARGPLGRLLAAGRVGQAEALLARLAETFPGRLYMEIQRHGLPEEEATEEHFLRLAYAAGIPLVATNDIHFADPAMHEAHDCLVCIRDQTTVDDPNRERFTPEHGFKGPDEMRRMFADLPEAADNTLVVARRCSFLLEGREPILPAAPGTDGRPEAELLAEQAEAGLERRLERHVLRADMDAPAREAAAAPYRERLAYELGVISETAYAGYFLIVAEFVNWAQGQGIPVGPGRGSGAGSVVAWALNICNVDPLRFGLLFERFLNPERVTMPDFDIDFCQLRRDEVIAHVRERYGADRVAQIITFGSLQARAAVRNVGRVLGMAYNHVDRLAKMIPQNPADPVSLERAMENDAELRAARGASAENARLFDIALRLEGLHRNASTHAAGVVIGDRSLEDLIPLYRDPGSEVAATQYAMKYVEKAGLVKFDFLGLKTLTVLDIAARHIRGRGGGIDLDAVPLDDPATFALLGEGATDGVFQLESPPMREILRQLAPNRFEDIVAVLALYRPGPMDNIPAFIARKHGREEVRFPHEALRGVLEETFGIWVYQEQVMETARVLAGFSLGEADLLRRAMGKKIRKEMDALRAKFVEGAGGRGVEARTAQGIFNEIAKFAGYGFNKSHAVGYALISYWTAYFKAHHPAEFLAATMTIVEDSKLNVFRGELARLGIDILPPDINRSQVGFTVEERDGRPAVRCGLGPIYGTSRAAMARVVAVRGEGGPFADVWDLARRARDTEINVKQVESLAEAGAFDSLLPSRARAFAAASAVVRCGAVTAAAERSSQENLFASGGVDDELWVVPEVEDWPGAETLAREFQALGFYASGHPLEEHAATIEDLGATPLALLGEAGGGPVKVAGIVVQVEERVSRKGSRFARVRLSDTTKAADVILFPDILARVRDLVAEGALLLATVEVQADEDRGHSVIAREIARLDRDESVRGYVVFADEGIAWDGLRAAVDRASPGGAFVRVVVPADPDHEAEIDLGVGIAPAPALRSAMKSVAGVLQIREVADGERAAPR